MKNVFLSALLLLAGGSAFAQDATISDDPPLQNARQAYNRLFRLPESENGYYFQVNLPGADFLTLRFNRLSHYEPGRLGEIVRLAAEAAVQFRDSFVSSTSARRIALHVPPANAPVIAAVREWGADEKIGLLRGAQSQPLRIAADTISILKTGSPGRDGAAAPQVQYTFLLKDLDDLRGLADDPQLVAQAEASLDSLVAAKRAKWRHPDAAYHRLAAVYDAPTQQLQIGRPGRVNDLLVPSGQFGIGALGGALASEVELGLSYQNNAVKGWPFVGLTLNSLVFYRLEDDKLKARSLSYLNVEFGHSKGFWGVYRTSLGVGYQISAYDAGPYNAKFHLYFTYSVSEAVSLVPEFYSSFSRSQNDRSRPDFFGISVHLRAF